MISTAEHSSSERLAQAVFGHRVAEPNPIRADYDRRERQALSDAIAACAAALSAQTVPPIDVVRTLPAALYTATHRLGRMERDAVEAQQVSDWYQARVRQVESESAMLTLELREARSAMTFLDACDAVSFTRRGHTILTSGDGLADAIADERAGDQRARDAREMVRRMTAGT